jgi:hypothetical protein
MPSAPLTYKTRHLPAPTSHPGAFSQGYWFESNRGAKQLLLRGRRGCRAGPEPHFYPPDSVIWSPSGSVQCSSAAPSPLVREPTCRAAENRPSCIRCVALDLGLAPVVMRSRWPRGAERQDRRRGLCRAGLRAAARGRAVAGVGTDGDLDSPPGRRAARRRVPGPGGAAARDGYWPRSSPRDRCRLRTVTSVVQRDLVSAVRVAARRSRRPVLREPWCRPACGPLSSRMARARAGSSVSTSNHGRAGRADVRSRHHSSGTRSTGPR